MELYHQTLLRPIQSMHALAAHLLPIKPKEEQEKPKQLVIARACSLELFHYAPSKSTGGQKYDLKSFCREEVFSNICAIEAVEYSDEDLKKELILLSLINGKYQLFEWMPQSSRLSLRDQNYIFSNESEVESGLCKPIPGHYISVNNDAKMVLIACANWEFKIYIQTLGYAGVRLESLLYYQQPYSNPSVCLQLAKGYAENLFYSLRTHSEQGKRVKVHVISKKGQSFQEETIALEDSSAHLLIPREGGSFIAIGKQNMTFYTQGNCSLIKLPQIREYLQSCYFKRIRDRKEQLFILNEQGQMLIINVDENKANGCVASCIQRVFCAFHIVTLERNLFFSVSASDDNYLFQFSNHYKPEEKTRSGQKIRQDRQEVINPKYPTFRQVQIVSSIPNSRMIRDMKVANLQKGGSSQIIVTGGRPGNKKGFFSVFKYGLKVKQYLTVNFMNPVGAWCIKKSIADKHHSYIVFAFANRKTSSYNFENNMLSHTNQLKLEESQTTLHVGKLSDGSIVQVTASKIRHIQKENYSRDINIKGRIMKATCVTEGRQLFILLIGGFMEYYQLNSNGELKVVNEFSLDSQAHFIDYSPPEYIDNKPFSRLIAIGKTNFHINLYTVEGKGLELKKTRNIKCQIESLSILNVDDHYQIVVGTNVGKMIKLFFNKKTEETNEPEEIIIGDKSVKFSKISLLNKLNLIRICPEPTLCYSWQGQQQQCTLPLPNIDFVSQIVVEGNERSCIFLTYFDNYLRFIEISGFGNLLQQFDKDIELTGRKILLCGDRVGILSEIKDRREDKEIWKSVFCLFNPVKNYFLEKYLQLQANQKCLCMCYVPRETGKGYICFGCVTDYQSYPTLGAQKPCIKVFSYQKDKDPLLTLLYSFSVEDIPTAMEVYLDKLLVGVGKKLILFDIFASKLLIRAVRASLPSYLNSIVVEGEKIITSELFNSFTIYRLNSIEKTFDYIGEDILPRFISASFILDGNYGVIAGGDKFGNFFVSKFSQKIKNEFQSGGQNKYSEFTDCNKLEALVSCNMGEVITAIQSGKLDERKPESIFYSSIDGHIGMFYPFDSQEQKEYTLLHRLQQQLRTSTLTCASNHEHFRSFYNPSKGVIDGDFCKLFENLSENQRDKIANALQSDSKQISALLSSMESKFK